MSLPPLYNEAISISTALINPSIDDIIKLVLPYICISDLPRCARVCRSWTRPCIILLWSDPSTELNNHTSPFDFANRFIDIILSPSVKQLLVTLNWSELISFVKKNNHRTFRVRDDLDLNTVACLYGHAPNVQFEILDGIDGRCDPELFEESKRYSVNSPQSLLLFSAANCHGLNCPSLMQSSDMESLLFLDMSFTRPDELLCRRFQQLKLPSLRILKLRGLRLTDWMLKIMVSEHTKLWSLDIRDNCFTDLVTESLGHLLGRRVSQRYQSLDKEQELEIYDYPPLYQRIEAMEEVGDVRPPSIRPDSKTSLINYIRKNGERNHWGQFLLDLHDPLFKNTGLTHLYLSGNKLTSGGIIAIMKYTDQLQVFDIGSLQCAAHKTALPATSVSFSLADVRPYFSRNIGTHLAELRVHHSIVTLAPTFAYRSEDKFIPSLLELSETVGAASWTTDLYDPFTIVSNFGIRTLTLTDTPRISHGYIINEIKTLLARYRLQEKILITANESQGSHRRATPLLPGLRTLRLEFTTPARDAIGRGSITGETDAANFNDESSKDFSFFEDPFTTSSSNKSKVRRRSRPSDFSFFSEQGGPVSSSSGESSGTSSPTEAPIEEKKSTSSTLNKLASFMRMKIAIRDPKASPPGTSAAGYSEEIRALAAAFVSLVSTPTGSPYISPKALKSSSSLAQYFTTGSNPAAHHGVATPPYQPPAVTPEDEQEEGKGKGPAKAATAVVYDVIEEIKKFRRECTTDEKWTGKLELFYETNAS